MGDFQSFKEHLMKGNAEGVRNNLRGEFVDKIVDDDNGDFPIHITCREGFVAVAKLLLDRNCKIECESKWGNRPIHYATCYGHSEIVKLLLDRNCNIECETKWKWRPIHYVSWKGQSEILKLLLRRKCRIDCKTKDGKSPLDIAKQFNRVDCVKLLTHMEKLFAIIERDDPIEMEKLLISCEFIRENIYTGLNVLEIAMTSNADKILKWIYDKSIDNKEIDEVIKEMTTIDKKNGNLLKECILYLCITRHHMRGIKRFHSAEVINGQRRIVGPTFLELAVEHGCDLLIDLIMRKTIYNKSIWIKAIGKAKDNGFIGIQKEIQERMILMESRQKSNFTIFHTAISDNDVDMLQYLLDHPNIVDLNSNNETFGTALALAYSLHQRNCIAVLQQYQLDVNTRNKYSETPLHEAIASGMDADCGYLIGRSIDIDQTGYMGMTGLHCAVIRGLLNVCTQLVNRGADCMRSVNLSCQHSVGEISIPFAQSFISLTVIENSLTLSLKFHRTIFPCFLKKLNLNSSNAHDGDNNSLLHLAVKCLQPDICSSLLNAGAQVDSVNNFGNSPLLELFADREIPVDDDTLNKLIGITNILIVKGADVNFKSSNGISAFQSASNIESEKLMVALVSNHPRLINFSSNDIQTAFLNQWFIYAELLIELLPDDFLSFAISNDTFQSCESAGTNLIKLLFNKSSSALQQSVIENLLYKAVNSNDVELFDHFIRTEISAPKSLGNGENLLTFILHERKIEFAWKLLDSVNRGKFVKLRNINNQIPLQIAIEIEEMDLVNALIIETKDCDSENEGGTCALTQLLEKISIFNNVNFRRKLISAIKSIILSGGDIYKMTSCGQHRIIDACTDSVAKEEIERYHRNNAKPSTEENKPDNEIAPFLIPIIKSLSENGTESPASAVAFPKALIMAPTRELCRQIFTAARHLCRGSNIKCAYIYGGIEMNKSRRNIQATGCDILVATPGRLIHFLELVWLSLRYLQFFVLDEADRMLDSDGFYESVTKIYNEANFSGDDRSIQISMFSATFPNEIQTLARNLLKNYLFLAVGVVGSANSDVKQEIIQSDQREKVNTAIEYIKTIPDEKTLIFVESKRMADFMGIKLGYLGFKATTIHGDREQEQREIALNDFKSGRVNFMVATNVAARGLDIPKVDNVINIDMPDTIDTYVHRIGRTGRCGNVGRAISFFDEMKDIGLAQGLVSKLQEANQECPDWLRALCDGSGSRMANYSRDTRKNVKSSKYIDNPTDDGFMKGTNIDYDDVKPTSEWLED